MNKVSATLKVVLYAEKVVVAESEDAALWRKVLAAIQGADDSSITPRHEDGGKVDTDQRARSSALADSGSTQTGKQSTSISKFAAEIGASVEEVQAACDPSLNEPYLILDHDAWAAFKNQLGERGPNAVSPAVAAATLLALWFKNSGVEANATQAQAQVVLNKIHVRDSNPARGIKRAEWLQPRAGGQVIITPTKIARARTFARCFCKQDWKEWLE